MITWLAELVALNLVVVPTFLGVLFTDRQLHLGGRAKAGISIAGGAYLIALVVAVTWSSDPWQDARALLVVLGASLLGVLALRPLLALRVHLRAR